MARKVSRFFGRAGGLRIASQTGTLVWPPSGWPAAIFLPAGQQIRGRASRQKGYPLASLTRDYRFRKCRPLKYDCVIRFRRGYETKKGSEPRACPEHRCTYNKKALHFHEGLSKKRQRHDQRDCAAPLKQRTPTFSGRGSTKKGSDILSHKIAVPSA